MVAKDYQTPELLIFLLEDKDVVRTSTWDGGGGSSNDKGVEDFFGSMFG